MNGEGSSKSTLKFGEKHFREEEEECSVEKDGGNKRIKEMPIDRFGELPDSLVIHILSFLNVKEAAVTSILSKRWEFLWADLPSLEFLTELPSLEFWGDAVEINKVSNFVSWVNRTLAIRRVNYLEKFYVSFIYHKMFSSDVDGWVQFAVKNKVKKLNLHIYCWDDIYRPPQVLYSCPSLTTLHVKGCIMVSKRTIEWKSLTSLHLHVVYVDAHLLDEILSSCPVLYTLCLEKCRGFNSLEVNTRSLHRLTIVDYVNGDAPLLRISAPYLHRLDISLLVGRKLQVVNMSSLVRAVIDYQEFSWGSNSLGLMMIDAREFLESVQHAKELHVGLQFCKVLSRMVVTGWQLPQSRRERLVVSSDSEYEHSVSGIIGLLGSSPNLETLVIEGRATEGEDVVLLPAVEDALVGDLLHLKTVKVSNFADSKGEPILTLARILLKRARVLEEMMITPNLKDSSDFTEMVQAMLTYPRSSPKAIVRLVR